MIEIREIDELHKQDIALKNDPFPIWGKLIPGYQDGKWTYSIEKLPESCITQMCFPDAGYDYAAMSGDSVFLGAYDGETCVGLALLQKNMFRYMYLADLNVQDSHRRMGVGKKLIQAALETAAQLHYRGIYLIAQDNNLSACLFYLSCGFRLGGLDTEVYNGTSQEGKADLHFYLDIPGNRWYDFV